MKEEKLGKVREIALRIIKENPSHYSRDFINSIPEELLDTDLVDDNLGTTGIKIDEVRFQKEKDIASIVDLTDKKIREQEIRFLARVARVVIHQ